MIHFTSPASVHRDQLRAQRSVTSMGKLYLFYPGRPVPEETFSHPLTTILIIRHPLSSSSIYNDPWHPLCSVYEFDSPLGQPLFGLPLGLGPQLHSPCISSPNHHHLFAAHAHTNAACFAAIPMLCLSLSSLLGSLSFNFTPHIHLTILISAR